ncbi:lethal(3)malignant brain tumor-like protein 1 isoform X1 [Teleopsis dalmanni]|uniref:lethal(3)malignant brain tumor-like protein 1 isoform X1 n=2 Tax=Teleopsis dalmanni TaxID=139649 RepID=UPI0018CF7B10|nr:lethal(3)malignant brain tumor-like protein 1 isoform X1 [Teleopsis dalmanni]
MQALQLNNIQKQNINSVIYPVSISQPSTSKPRVYKIPQEKRPLDTNSVAGFQAEVPVLGISAVPKLVPIVNETVGRNLIFKSIQNTPPASATTTTSTTSAKQMSQTNRKSSNPEEDDRKQTNKLLTISKEQMLVNAKIAQVVQLPTLIPVNKLTYGTGAASDKSQENRIVQLLDTKITQRPADVSPRALQQTLKTYPGKKSIDTKQQIKTIATTTNKSASNNKPNNMQVKMSVNSTQLVQYKTQTSELSHLNAPEEEVLKQEHSLGTGTGTPLYHAQDTISIIPTNFAYAESDLPTELSVLPNTNKSVKAVFATEPASVTLEKLPLKPANIDSTNKNQLIPEAANGVPTMPAGEKTILRKRQKELDEKARIQRSKSLSISQIVENDTNNERRFSLNVESIETDNNDLIIDLDGLLDENDEEKLQEEEGAVVGANITNNSYDNNGIAEPYDDEDDDDDDDDVQIVQTYSTPNKEFTNSTADRISEEIAPSHQLQITDVKENYAYDINTDVSTIQQNTPPVNNTKQKNPTNAKANYNVLNKTTKKHRSSLEIEITPDVSIIHQSNAGTDTSLLCDEPFLLSSSSSTTASSNNNSRTLEVEPTTVIKKIQTTKTKSSESAGNKSAACSDSRKVPEHTRNLLAWNNNVGSARGTDIRFELNEFSLLQIHERCAARERSINFFEKPIGERQISLKDDPLLYMCKHCNTHGPAVKFLAPQYCSTECLNRSIIISRGNVVAKQISSKRQRSETYFLPVPSNNSVNIAKRTFRWTEYLSDKNGRAAPIHLFINPFPVAPNMFQVGMKLEAIDPMNCSLFCVCTIVEIQGFRMKLHFDGYDIAYDFWVNADSMDIFPPGWCSKNNRVLQPPKGIDHKVFNWHIYLDKTKGKAAYKHLFTHLKYDSSQERNPFKVGMHLEAEDLNGNGQICVASVADVLGDRIRVHFDGYKYCFDYWVDICSPYIHPCGWHSSRQELTVPPKFKYTRFDWAEYIKQERCGVIAPEEFFRPRDPIDFKPHMKLEVVDPCNPTLIRPSHIISRKGHRIKVLFEGWQKEYAFWLEDDSPDLHPIGWCDGTDHKLEPPPCYQNSTTSVLCTLSGCRGIGNAKNCHLNTHTTVDSCPYFGANWFKRNIKPLRIDSSLTIRKPIIKTNIDVQKKQTSKIQNILMETQNQPRLQKVEAFHPERKLDMTRKRRNSVSVVDLMVEQPEIKIAKNYLCDYGPRLLQTYDLWQMNQDFNMSDITTNPMNWTIKETCAFVEKILSSHIACKFSNEEIDGTALLMLSQSNLTDDLAIHLGPAVKLFSHILSLRALVVKKFLYVPVTI